MAMDGFSTWVSNHVSRCSGQQNLNHQQKRLDKCSVILKDVTKCEKKANSHTFVIPESRWWLEFEHQMAEKGGSFEFSASCNPDFVNGYGLTCSEMTEGCGAKAQHLFIWAAPNEQGI